MQVRIIDEGSNILIDIQLRPGYSFPRVGEEVSFDGMIYTVSAVHWDWDAGNLVSVDITVRPF